MDQRDVEMAAEQPDHLLALAGPHQAVVDEDAGQLVADRLVDQHRRDRRIDAAGEAADDAALADLGADRRARLGAEGGHRPVALHPGDVVDEIADQPGAVGGVDDLGVEHQAVVAALLVGDQREGRVLRGADAGKAGRQAGDAVAVAHPHDMALAGLPHAVEQAGFRRRRRPRRGRIRGGGRFRPRRRAARPWSSGRSRCRAPARRKRRSPAARGGSLVGHRGRAAGEDHRLGLQRREGGSAFWNGAISQ